MAYSKEVLEHYENPRNVGSMDKDDPNVGTGRVGAPACGDVMKLQIRVSDDGVIPADGAGHPAHGRAAHGIVDSRGCLPHRGGDECASDPVDARDSSADG